MDTMDSFFYEVLLPLIGVAGVAILVGTLLFGLFVIEPIRRVERHNERVRAAKRRRPPPAENRLPKG